MIVVNGVVGIAVESAVGNSGAGALIKKRGVAVCAGEGETIHHGRGTHRPAGGPGVEDGMPRGGLQNRRMGGPVTLLSCGFRAGESAIEQHRFSEPNRG